jgi:hypothetical protein
MNHHTLTVDVADSQVGQLRAPGAGSVEAHKQNALAGSACRMDELRDFFLAKNRGEAMCPFRIGSIGNAPGSAKRLNVGKTQCCQTLRYRARRFSFPEQLRLIFANVSRA